MPMMLMTTTGLWRVSSIQDLPIDSRLKRLARAAFEDDTKTIAELNREDMMAIMDQNGIEHRR